MDWIGKFFIVLTCFTTFIFTSAISSPALAATRCAQTSAEASKAPKKRTARKSHSRRATSVSVAQGKNVSEKSTAKKSKGRRSRVAKKAAARPEAYVALGEDALARRLSARSAMIMDAVSGSAIYAQAAESPAQPASTIKVLTGVISLDALPKDELVTVSRKAAMMPRAKVYLRPGKRYPANDLINAVLLASANDASVALAERIGGSEEVFARLMTAKARSFGATNTVCKTANGLTASGQYTTAHDLARIFNNAMRNNEFAGKMAVTKVVTTEGKVIKSHNRALWQVAGAEGGKTGYTQAAGKTYVGKFKRDNDEIVVSLMGSGDMWGDLRTLVEYGFAKKKREARGAVVTNKPASPQPYLVQLGNSPRQLPVVTSL